jgi:peptide chain release factor 1
MRDMLEKKQARFEELEQKMMDPAVQIDSSRMAAVAREHGSLAKLVTKYRRFKGLNEEITDANEMLKGSDPDMRELAEAELPELKADREVLWNELLGQTIGGEDANRSRCIMEIRAGAGGDEAALFARDLYDMYKHYAESQRWKLEIMSMNPTELGGFKDLKLALSGEGVYRTLQFESGGHRVQRVPETETKGRIHTSAATVAVMPEPEEVEVNLTPNDYRKDLFNASGPGGQHVNKTESAVRLTHHETGIVVSCQDESSQHKNLAKALRELRARVYDHIQQEETRKRADARKSLIGSGDRSQRIRTYNFPENRITDHRIGLTLYKLENILSGNLEPVIEALMDHERQELQSAFGAFD